MTDEQLEAYILSLLPYVFREAAEAYGLAAPSGCTRPEPETLRTQSPMRVSLPTPPNLIEGEASYPAAEVVQNLEQEVAHTLSDARADMALLASCVLSPTQRDLAEQLHGTLAHALHLACLLREVTEQAR